MKDASLLSKLVEKIELEILSVEESAFIGGSAGPIIGGNNCKCNGNNCSCNYTGNNCKCNGNNCSCQVIDPVPNPRPNPQPIEGPTL